MAGRTNQAPCKGHKLSQQAQHHWFEADPRAKFDDLLEALGLYKDISTEYGLNQSVHQQWRFGDPLIRNPGTPIDTTMR